MCVCVCVCVIEPLLAYFGYDTIHEVLVIDQGQADQE